jgi:hypothetical protein
MHERIEELNIKIVDVLENFCRSIRRKDDRGRVAMFEFYPRRRRLSGPTPSSGQGFRLACRYRRNPAQWHVRRAVGCEALRAES